MKRKRRRDSGSAHSASSLLPLLLQQLDVLHTVSLTPAVTAEPVDSSPLVLKVEVDEVNVDIAGSGSGSGSGDEDDLAQYIRSEEEMAELQQLEQAER